MEILRIVVLCMLALVLAEAAAAASGHTTLLATSEPLQGGVTADLYLETKPGTGRVFIESNPLTKIDTQISTRFAKEIACEYSGKDCSSIDFFYAIKANAAIIGGPSAGAAMAALTVGVLEGAELNQSVAVTGTINSGNTIGHVGGVPEKIEAAHDAGIRKVLIPKGEVISFESNMSVDAIEYGKAIGVDVAQVFSLDEVMKDFTGKAFGKEEGKIEADKKYVKVMEGLASRLCNRTAEFEKSFASAKKDDEIAELASNLSRQGFNEQEKHRYYSAASFCLGANVRYNYLELISEKLTREEVASRAGEVEKHIDRLEKGLKNASTVSDAQIIAVMLDRSAEARQHANISIAAMNANETNISIFELAFAVERMESVEAWSSFLGVMGESKITQDMLKNACTKKLAEAQERVEYSSILIRSPGDGAVGLLEEAQIMLDKGDYVQCMHKATLSKSEANMMLGVLGMRDDDIHPIVEGKLKAAENVIARQSEKGIFPILGYSYYEYANSLKDTDKYSALLFSEYALEFSNIEVYFRPSEATAPAQAYESADLHLLKGAYMFGSFAVGFIIALMIGRATRRKKGRILVRKASRAGRH